jgi:hypothetical protein
MFERVKDIIERLDVLTNRVEKVQRVLDQEKSITGYYVAFGRYVQEIREKEEVNDAQSVLCPTTWIHQPQVPGYGLPSCYQCGQLGYIRRECPTL